MDVHCEHIIGAYINPSLINQDIPNIRMREIFKNIRRLFFETGLNKYLDCSFDGSDDI